MQEDYEILLKEIFPVRQSKEIMERYQQWEYIGKGAGSEVIKVIDCASNNAQRAIKKYNKTQLASSNAIDILREVAILEKLETLPQNHHFVKLYDKFSISYNGYSVDYGIVLQLCNRSLKDIFDTQDQITKLTEIQKLQLCLHIAEGVNILHQNNIIHRDLKPANILMVIQNGKQIPLIADFGHSKQFQQHNDIEASMTRMRGTIQYNHPDISNARTYGFEWDNYQLGIIFYQIFNEGRFLFSTAGIRSIQVFQDKLRNQLKNIKDLLENNDRIINPMKNIIQSCLDISKSKNLKFANVVRQLNQIIYKQHKIEQQHNQIEENINNVEINTVTTNDKSIQKIINNKVEQQGEQQIISSQQVEQQQHKQILEVSNSLSQKKAIDQPKQAQKYTSLIQIDSQKKQLRKNHSIQIKISDVKQNNKKFSAQQSEGQNFPKLISSYKKIVKKQAQLKQSLYELQKLKMFEQKLTSFKIIQNQNIQKCDKRKLLLFCLKYTILSIKKSKDGNKNEFTKKYYELLHSTLQSEFKKILLQFTKFDRHLINQEGYTILQSQYCQLGRIVNIYRHYVKNSNISVNQLSHVLQLLN